jgi:hypothetical protein
VNLDELIGREKAVADPLFQRISEDRLAEIVGIGDIFGFLRRAGEADLRRPGKMVEDFPPRRIRRSTATMAFVDDDQIEEAWRKLAIELLSVFRPGDRLIEPRDRPRKRCRSAASVELWEASNCIAHRCIRGSH